MSRKTRYEENGGNRGGNSTSSGRTSGGGGREFKLELLNAAQKQAWSAFQKYDVLFLLGPAGSGKTFLATAFAIKTLLSKECDKIILTRPIVEAGESLGFLPGDFNEKVSPYMMPIYDCIDQLFGPSNPTKDRILSRTEVAPIAYMRGRTFHHSVCVFDEAQNATKGQLKLFLSRFGKESKIIITGDPKQTDIGSRSGLAEVADRLEKIPEIGIVRFDNKSIVRHPLIGSILDELDDVENL